MGIRVHKVIGYGLTDLIFEEDEKHYSKKMVDARINWKQLNKLYDKAYKTTPKIFTNWLERNWEEILKLEAEERCVPLEDVRKFSSIYMPLFKDHFKRHKNWRLSNCFIHQDEQGLPNVIVFIPPTQVYGEGGWKRYDDTIDWIEETNLYEAENRVVELPCAGIYPYNHQVVRFRETKPDIWPDFLKNIERDGMKVDEKGLPRTMMVGDYNMLIGRWDPKMKPQADGELFNHLKNDWRPQIPSELLALLLWLKDCFRDFNEIKNSLRPLLYVYWS